MTSRRVHLEVLEVREPCTEDWNRMRGDDRSRFCGTCRNHVYDLSAMTREDAEALVSRASGRICVRFYRRADGTVVTADCTPLRYQALRRRARRALAFAGAIIASTVSAVLGLGLTTEDGRLPEKVRAWVEPEEVVVMGEAAPPHFEELGRVSEVQPAPAK